MNLSVDTSLNNSVDNSVKTLASYIDPLPLIAVLRGITPEEIPAIAKALVGEGFRVLEVPLNSPRPFDSIRLLADACGDRCLVGAGTVIAVADVARVRAFSLNLSSKGRQI